MPSDRTFDCPSHDEQRPDVSVLASTVLSVLSDKGSEGVPTIRDSVVEKLVDAALASGIFNAETVMMDLRERRISADQMVNDYIPCAAREMGEMWVQDFISFAQVTIGTARLQGMLTLLAPPWTSRPADPGKGATTLFVLQAGDSHTLGPHVATAQLRRLGASVRILFGPDSDAVVHALAAERYDLVLFSASRADSLASIAKMVKSIRSRVLVPPQMVLGGIVLNLAADVRDMTGVDLVTNDVNVALKLREKTRSGTRFLAR